MIRAVVAIDIHNGIARDGSQPWHISGDARYFSELTRRYGANVLMGRRTFEVIGKALPGRHNFVVSHNAYMAKDAENVNDLGRFLQSYRNKEDIWVIGGSSVYGQVLYLVHELYITKIDATFDCDQFFPEYKAQFMLVDSSEPLVEHGLRYQFTRYVKKD
jgi:dihydrofolate reductase